MFQATWWARSKQNSLIHGASLFKERSCRSALDRSHYLRDPFCSESALVNNKTATLNEHTSVLTAILNDISDDSDTNFIHILLASECQQRKNEEHCKTNNTPNEITVCLQTNSWVTWLKLLESKFFWSPKKWERSRGNKSFSQGSFPKIRIDPWTLFK